ncbi:MAG: GIY-YIG nuclease family protein [Deltaproteobacteria bacterium]|nr:GIY-YIG nuclease family protein [Deltaproteobacteria bacterium]
MNKRQQPYQYSLEAGNLLEVIPDGPGVYLFKDQAGRILYVGKAKSLHKRLLSYLKPSAELPYKTSLMMRRAKGLDFILTSSEKEALILESTLIKKHRPRYNILLRDDSQYPCLRLSLEDEYPRLSIARRIKKDGSRYFGPFSSAKAVMQR